MKLNRLLIYFLILVAIAGWLYFVEVKHKQEKKAAEEKAAKIVDLEKDKISEVELKSADRTIEIKRPANQWVLTSPIKAKADDRSVDGLLAACTDAKSEKILAEKDWKSEDYGLDKPELTVILKTPEKAVEMAFGALNPAKTSYYVRVEGDPRLFLVADGVKSSLDRTVFDLREKTVLGIGPGDVERIIVSEDGKQTELQLEATDKWVMVKPEHFKVKTNHVSRNVMSLANLQAKEIIDEPQKDGDPYGLDKSQTSILLAGKKISQTLLIGKAVDKDGKPPASEPDRYARVKDQDTVYVVDGSTLKDFLQTAPEQLQDRSVLAFDPPTVEKLEIELDGKKWLAIKGKETKWDLEQPEKKSGVDAWPISSILWELKDVEWKSVDKAGAKNLKPVHLDKPKLVISLYNKDEKEPSVFKAGWEDVVPPKQNAKARKEAQAGKGRAETEKKAEAAAAEAKTVLPPTMNVIVEPSEEKGAVYVVDSGFVDRLRMDLERLVEKKK